ncbi:Ap4A phosphorylase-like protein II [Decorospora gaudefroyi]|uniref:Ap4A phosphorylase-like protein II n=1 Tax=Decorospora gaudefroyi TaxID=184978 RepID=A0A6A5KV32_9PLEO|nr:Ap4A phosphorylase-like protein II [Decorospora gaudefroyi]
MRLGLSEALPSLVEAKFKAAKASSSLLFSSSDLAIIRTTSGIPFQLRYCPSLAKKPAPKQPGASPKPNIDPFDNPPHALHIADIPTANPTHLLVLNKFPIIPQHFILATKANKGQTHFLEQDDLEAAYACLKTWRETEGPNSQQKRLFAFFNSGENSGASQPHRHLQFLPVEGMRDGQATGVWQLLLDIILQTVETSPSSTPRGVSSSSPELPFTHFARLFGSEPSGAELLAMYKDLYQAAKAAIETFIAANPEQLAFHPTDGGDLPISYNLAMTTAGMAILPRRAAGTMLRRDDGSDIGFIALNGTTLGGTMMVKYQEEWDVLRGKPQVLDNILAAIGVPKVPQQSKPHV